MKLACWHLKRVELKLSPLFEKRKVGVYSYFQQWVIGGTLLMPREAMKSKLQLPPLRDCPSYGRFPRVQFSWLIQIDLCQSQNDDVHLGIWFQRKIQQKISTLQVSVETSIIKKHSAEKTNPIKFSFSYILWFTHFFFEIWFQFMKEQNLFTNLSWLTQWMRRCLSDLLFIHAGLAYDHRLVCGAGAVQLEKKVSIPLLCHFCW